MSKVLLIKNDRPLFIFLKREYFHSYSQKQDGAYYIFFNFSSFFFVSLIGSFESSSVSIPSYVLPAASVNVPGLVGHGSFGTPVSPSKQVDLHDSGTLSFPVNPLSKLYFLIRNAACAESKLVPSIIVTCPDHS